jgi:hypothetical protein
MKAFQLSYDSLKVKLAIAGFISVGHPCDLDMPDYAKGTTKILDDISVQNLLVIQVELQL